MWVAQPVVAHWVYYKIRTSRETWQTRSLRQEVCCAYSDVILFFLVSWVSKVKTAVPHSSAGGECIRCHGGLHMQGIAAELVGHRH